MHECYQDIDITSYQAQFSAVPHYLIDVREVDEYVGGHLPQAVNIPLSVFQERVQEIGSDLPIVLVCASGGRSAMAAEYVVASLGHDKVYNLVGGTLGWMMRGLPLERAERE
ncbi:MAG: rhodanese-like domain-containing protein [Anaerolineae bacterium]|nr:rhodanese-like domain-containing protein [Anaerolineae bacterium]MDW8172990.1 rhodanese-like domain-containing protein [Anaerolineae bacterium]